ncbi:MAG: TOBE domain-containing protein [Proteobacteria bacterium]|nr:TOBE domain-containing protein [Pseudomonadota bacterium]MBU2235071.1 TOBE domain-containing protein [Pseudomonadota bacterium]MBU4074022.1 TOBE domain-containing protein [Pseudomonadota bacterium]
MLIVIRPEGISLSLDSGNRKQNVICGTLRSYMYAGSIAKCTVMIGDKKMIIDQYNPRDAQQFLHAAKVEVEIPQSVHLLKKK